MTKVLACAFVLASVAMGCQPKDDADRFRSAVPAKEDVALKIPGSSDSGGTTTQSLHPLGNPPSVSSSAEYYRFTRDITDVVDFGTAVILGAIEIIVHSPPTTIDSTHAVWGPGSGDALDPVVWRFTVTEVAPDEYDYVLEGQRKGTSDFVAALSGHGFGDASPSHKQGWFQADNDALASLDPDRNHDTGSTKVTFDLRQIPASIAVDIDKKTDGSAHVVVTHEAGGAGEVDITAHTDIDPSKGSGLEDVTLHSKWLTDGSGRADAQLAGGDLPTTVDATECWSTTFSRVYYQDTVSYEPTSGDASKCSLASTK
jgi:hypothetical protein